MYYTTCLNYCQTVDKYFNLGETTMWITTTSHPNFKLLGPETREILKTFEAERLRLVEQDGNGQCVDGWANTDFLMDLASAMPDEPVEFIVKRQWNLKESAEEWIKIISSTMPYINVSVEEVSHTVKP